VIDETNELLLQISSLSDVAERSQELEQRVESLQAEVEQYRRLSTGANARQRVHSDVLMSALSMPAAWAARINGTLDKTAQRGEGVSPLPNAQHWLAAFPEAAGGGAVGTSPSAGDVALIRPRSTPPGRRGVGVVPKLRLLQEDFAGTEGWVVESPAISRLGAAGRCEEETWKVKSSEWKLNAQLLSTDVAIARLRNESKDELKGIIKQLESELVSRDSRLASHQSPEKHTANDATVIVASTAEHSEMQLVVNTKGARDSEGTVCSDVAETATFSWLRNHVHRHVALCTSEMQKIQGELQFLQQQYCKTGDALASVEIALEDSLAREASTAAAEEERKEQHAKQVRALEDALAEAQGMHQLVVTQTQQQIARLRKSVEDNESEVQGCVSNAESIAQSYVRLQLDMLHVHAAVYPSTEENVGGMCLAECEHI
jgi:hypothetical protein